TSVRKGDIYETNSGQLLEVTNGRLTDEEEHGASFEGRSIEFNLETGHPNRSKTTDRFYLDELAKKLSKKDYDEWVEIGRREAEALTDAKAPEAEPAKATTSPAATKPAKARKPKTDGKPSEGKLSQLEAAVKVLTEAGEPMTTKAMIEAMAANGYWTSPGGATPWATLYSALIREIANKGDESRFTKVDRGQFALNTPAAATKPAPKTTGKKATKKITKKTKPADGTPGPKAVSDLFKI
ncbi:MAG: winged helix-turn-helix domain-containing protein, partial [Alphaproteobacteria bacterium]|nr:winged helix-turn-helix domain-containing protein [Alphaproteobacteria bacterium]